VASRLKIPPELLVLYPNLTKVELRTIINTFWKSKSNKLRQSHIFHLTIKNIGTIKSMGNKRPKHYKNTLKRDSKRKRVNQRKKELTIEYLLF